MELKIINENDNVLFGRKEVKAQIESEIMPNRIQVLDTISKKFTCPIENIKIVGIKGSFGNKNFMIEANIYNSKKDKEEIELKKKKDSIAVKQSTEKVTEETASTATQPEAQITEQVVQ